MKKQQRRLHPRRIPITIAMFLLFVLVGQTNSQTGLQFNGSNQYVTTGVTPSNSPLNTTNFTIETWFRRDGTGTSVSTGTGGITAIPLVTKGTSEAETGPADINYFLGINTAGNVLCADFEEAQSTPNPGLNHPISGVTPINVGTWYHAAVTYDGTTLRLFLNGIFESELVVSRPPNTEVISPFAMATSIRSNGTTIQGYFNGVLDEVRVWNYARTQLEIQQTLNVEITSAQTGLLGRWGLNNATGTTATNSISGSPSGTLVNTPTWVQGFADDALWLGSGTAYVTFGNNSALGLAQFTLECWFRRDGTGTTASSGTGGITAIPLITKGVGESESGNLNMNYFLGVRSSDNVLAADFEEASGPNHVVAGSTPIVTGQWYHAAATYDGSTWRLYLNGSLEASLFVGLSPQSASIQHAGLGTALSSSGAASGHFYGALDEVRIWNSARTQTQIQTTINSQLTGMQTGLVGRWGLNEGTGTLVHSTAGTTIDGTITNTGWFWTSAAPFNIVISPPAAPSELSATAISSSQITLTWTDNANNETGFEIERSTTGIGGTYSLLTTVGADVSSYDNVGLTPSTEYCYRVRAINSAGPSGYAGPVARSTPAEGDFALDLGSSNAYVTLGAAPSLNTPVFTLETWFRRDGTGVANTTGTGGIDAVPLIAKGAAESEASNVDINYFLGIKSPENVLCADFEEGAGGSSPSQNHPISGVTPISMATWYHAAATYDGTTWKLYLNGNLEAQLIVGQPVASATTSPAALGTSLRSNGTTAQGFFDGVIDEVRIWNTARSLAEIQSTINTQITSSQTGLLGRWGLNEGSGTTVFGGGGTSVNGTIVGTGSSWITPGAPFNIQFVIPDPPSNLSVAALSNSTLQLTWNDNSSNEAGFEIDRSTNGPGGPFALLETVGANTVSYNSTGLSSSTEYCYRVRATNSSGASSYTSAACGITLAEANSALDFAGTNAYVRFEDISSLRLTTFTIETWFRRDGTGVATETGTGGIPAAIPLVSKGAADVDTDPLRDNNYFLGIATATNVLCADFEEGAGGPGPVGQNHPISGTTPIENGTWYHAAATYDGNKWQLFLNGNLEAELVVGVPAGSAGTSPASLATSLTQSGTAKGFLDGAIDEVRIWSVARTQLQIQNTLGTQLTTSQPNLVARWGLNEGSGTAVTGGAGTTINGSISGTGYAWIPGAPFNRAPDQPTLVGPANGGTNVPTSATLEVQVSDPENQSLTVQFYGRALTAVAEQDFTLVGLPDTQYYTAQMNGGTPAIFNAQMNWILNNISSRNIPYTAHLGDCVEHGDNLGDPIEWQRADAAYLIIENPTTTGLPYGMPYGIAVGNHDQSPNGDAAGTTTFYNQYFGSARFQGRSYYGGHYGSNNDNWYNLFSASGMDFIVIGLEYDPAPDQPVLDWADQVLTQYSNRRAIVVSHSLINTGNPGSFSAQGQAVYDRLKSHSNLFLMLCGHVPGEGRRQDTFGGNTITTLLSDYQSRTNGGNGWLRMLEFSPANNVVRVKTYSPTLDQYETDGDSQFEFAYNMSAAFQLLGTTSGIPSGSSASLPWSALALNTQYEWYVTVSDGNSTITGPTWTFTTAGAPAETWACPTGDCGHGALGFNTVQAAVNAVIAGGTVNVAAGTYNESAAIAKDVTLSGSGNPTIQNLIINTNQVTLGGSVNVAGVLTLSNGRFLLGNNNLTVASGGSIVVSGAIPPAGYIVTNGTGSLVQTVGNTNVVFPIGSVRTPAGACTATTSYNAVTLNNSGTLDVFSVRVKENWDNEPVDPSSSIRREWTVTEAVEGGSSVIMTLLWNNAAVSACGDVVVPQSNPSIGRWNPVTGTWWPYAATFAVPSNPYCTATSDAPFTSFSNFAVGGSQALPVQLTSFTGTVLSNRNVKLDWMTASEVNNLGFHVERKTSTDPAFTELPDCFIPGHGTTNVPQVYTYTDFSHAGGILRYRLRQIDLDGTAHYSESILVDVLTDVKEPAPLEFALTQNYPNPFNPMTEIKFSVKSTGRAAVTLYNTLGQQIATLFDGIAEAGQYYRLTVDGSGLASAVYFYRLESGDYSAMKKMILLK